MEGSQSSGTHRVVEVARVVQVLGRPIARVTLHALAVLHRFRRLGRGSDRALSVKRRGARGKHGLQGGWLAWERRRTTKRKSEVLLRATSTTRPLAAAAARTRRDDAMLCWSESAGFECGLGPP